MSLSCHWHTDTHVPDDVVDSSELRIPKPSGWSLNRPTSDVILPSILLTLGKQHYEWDMWFYMMILAYTILYLYLTEFPGKWVTHLVVPVISWLLERLHERAIQRGVPRCRLLISCASTSRGCRCAPRKLQPRKRRSPWRGGNSQVPGGLGGK
jgi:hypothetical protein